jgi:NAD(P)-dependent dehydrogenase (short-subunit alcohol dehydrogenase family)
MQDLHAKVVVITGAASGIGRAMADAFSNEGARIVIADIELEPLRIAEQQLRGSGAEVVAVQTDVAEPTSVDALANATLAAFGQVDIVCNNAGVGQSLRPVWEFSRSYWEWFLGVNLWGVINGIQTFVPILLRQGSEAHIVNTASVAGLLSYPLTHLGPYSAAKHAKSKIQVSVLCPGFVRTRIMRSERHKPSHLASQGHANAELEEMWNAAINAGADPKDIAADVLSAIRAERLYVLPNREFDPAIRSHAEDLVLQRNPALSAPETATA